MKQRIIGASRRGLLVLARVEGFLFESGSSELLEGIESRWCERRNSFKVVLVASWALSIQCPRLETWPNLGKPSHALETLGCLARDEVSSGPHSPCICKKRTRKIVLVEPRIILNTMQDDAVSVGSKGGTSARWACILRRTLIKKKRFFCTDRASYIPDCLCVIWVCFFYGKQEKMDQPRGENSVLRVVRLLSALGNTVLMFWSLNAVSRLGWRIGLEGDTGNALCLQL